MGMAVERAETETDISRKAAAYHVPSEAVDGMDPVAVEAAARRACEIVRSGAVLPFWSAAPTASGRILCSTPSSTATRRRSSAARARPDPAPPGWLEENGLIDQDDLARIEAEVRAEVEAALAFAEAGSLEPVEDLVRFVTMDKVPA